MNKDLLKTVIADQEYYFEQAKDSIKREFSENFCNSPEIVIITGIRRCGKSTLLQQIRATQNEKDYYINFDDERLVSFNVEDFQMLLEVFHELSGEQKTFYFDEIQNVEQWERFVRRLHDTGNKIYITGSNARMLSRELGTHLTGRYLSCELFPFSFKEFILLKKPELLAKNIHKTSTKAEILSLFHDYFNNGGFPNFVKTNDELALKTLFENILYRDIMVRNNITNEKEIKELVSYLAGNYARLSTNSELAEIIGVKNASTVKKYIGFLADSYLVFQTSKYDYSLSKQTLNPKKSYFIDNGLVRRIGFSFSDNLGHLLENLVFIELLRRGKKIYYHNKGQECDFVLLENKTVTAAIQVTYAMPTEKTRKREIDGLLDAMNAYNLQSGLIITDDTEEETIVENRKIAIVPVWKWLLNN
ncbi:MAG: ATP-binding protein [Dysgonamonadaceae bacterium]|jgi:predicted AAA+ superfamily ATPase|nr:ATP-binding protein [Dysgonamonadaceae bacterium]